MTDIGAVERRRGHYCPSSQWTSLRVERLRAMWAAKYSGGAIAAALGTTRGAIMGRLKRDGLLDDGRKPHHNAAEHATRPRPKPKASRPARATAPEIEPDDEPVGDSAPDIGPLAVTFFDLREGQCKWPLDRDGTRWSCGAPQAEPDNAGRNYCKFHAAIAYAPMHPKHRLPYFR